MDNLVLIRVAAVFDSSLARAVLRDFHQESDDRYRLVFESHGAPLSVTLSLDARQPWIGRPQARSGSFRSPPGPFAGRCRRSLRRRIVHGVTKGPDRTITLAFVDGHRLVAELVPHRSNLLLLDEANRVVACAKRPRGNRERTTPGAVYEAAGLPSASLNPIAARPAEIDARVAGRVDRGETPATALGRSLFGVSDETARLILEESRATGRSLGSVVASRMAALSLGEVDPLIEGPQDVPPSPARGPADPTAWRLLPWEPARPPEPPMRRSRGGDAAATAGLYYGFRERHRESNDRAAALLRILGSEVARQRRAESRIAADLASFEDPDRYRVWAEALLAGLKDARRSGDHVLVPDPYDPEGRSISVPAPRDRGLSQVAEELFRRHRRARRGLERARKRGADVAALRERLERLQSGYSHAAACEGTVELELAMRRSGLPVGLEPKRGRRAARTPPSRPRLEGVRLLSGSGGRSILVGKGGKENDRLTFKLAGPEDFWFHALGVPGAHVIVRNEGGESRPPGELLRQAAAVAAWFSDARKQPQADVQWTRRKYVRRLKGAAPGTVKVKKSVTVRVRPGVPTEAADPA